MDLRILSNGFSSTTYTVVPVSDAGQSFLGAMTQSVEIRKSGLGHALHAIESAGLKWFEDVA